MMHISLSYLLFDIRVDLQLTITQIATMKWILSAIALLGPAYVNALGKDISSRGAACDSSYNGKFQVTIGKVNKRDIEVSTKSTNLSHPTAWTKLTSSAEAIL